MGKKDEKGKRCRDKSDLIYTKAKEKENVKREKED